MAQLLFENSNDIPEGLYLQLMNSLKIINENERTVVPNTPIINDTFSDSESLQSEDESEDENEVVPAFHEGYFLTQCGFIVCIRNVTEYFLTIHQVRCFKEPHHRFGEEQTDYADAFYKMKRAVTKTKIFVDDLNGGESIKLVGRDLYARDLKKIGN